MRPFLKMLWTTALVAVIWVLVGWLLLHLRWLDRQFGLILPYWTPAVGLPLLIVGAILVLGCGGLLSTRGILSRRGEDWLFPTQFIAFGPFRYVRNPMSLGAVILIAGIGLCGRSGCVLAVAALAFVFVHGIVIFVEEAGLERRFGESYSIYKSRVNRWLPWWPRKI
jgi:protein-S-isoprenylcysteine O-methyltransferase Ste14